MLAEINLRIMTDLIQEWTDPLQYDLDQIIFGRKRNMIKQASPEKSIGQAFFTITGKNNQYPCSSVFILSNFLLHFRNKEPRILYLIQQVIAEIPWSFVN